MLQRGIETPNMDVRWVSSLSWYFLNLFGLNGLFKLLLGSDNCEYPFHLNSSTSYCLAAADSTKDMASNPMANLAPSGPLAPGQDMHKMYLQEKDSLELAAASYKWAAAGVEDRILARFSAKELGKGKVKTQ
jgi:hypothetical protein